MELECQYLDDGELLGTSVIAFCRKEVLLGALTSADTVVFDQPYPDREVQAYDDSTVDFEQLVDLLLKAKFKWVLCGYPHPYYARLHQLLVKFDPAKWFTQNDAMHTSDGERNHESHLVTGRTAGSNTVLGHY